uniref:Uncharacterized protein n=1 Tax=Rhizophora mucronata TaxID=61149 RepID=A0A2P2NIW7_RHIMU
MVSLMGCQGLATSLHCSCMYL